MALPVLETPKYTLELPSTGEMIEFRPFLVKEQKILLLAQQSNNQKMITKTTMDIIKNCTFNEVNEKNPLFDIEYLFLNIRAKSVGETVELIITCPDDEETKEKVSVNLEDINVQMTENHSNVINITDDIKLVMNYPTIKEVDVGKRDKADVAFDIIKKCVREVHDGDNIMNRSDFTDKELDVFFDSFNTEQFESVMEFFNSMPKLRHVLIVKNSKTGVENEITLEGLDSFF